MRCSAPDAARPHRFRGNASVVAVLGVVFGVLALAASTTVGTEFDVTPLLVVLGFAAVVTVWVVVGVPRLERRAALNARPDWRERIEALMPLVDRIESKFLLPAPFWQPGRQGGAT